MIIGTEMKSDHYKCQLTVRSAGYCDDIVKRHKDISQNDCADGFPKRRTAFHMLRIFLLNQKLIAEIQ